MTRAKSKPEGAETAAAEKFCEAAELSDRQLRNIAKAQWFPPPEHGKYQLWPTVRGLVRYYRNEVEKAGQGAKALREQKLKLEVSLLSLEEAREKGQNVSVDEIVKRLTPALTAMRHRLLAATELSEDTRDEIIEDLGRLYYDALRRPVSGGRKTDADSDPTAAPDRQQVG